MDVEYVGAVDEEYVATVDKEFVVGLVQDVGTLKFDFVSTLEGATFERPERKFVVFLLVV